MCVEGNRVGFRALGSKRRLQVTRKMGTLSRRKIGSNSVAIFSSWIINGRVSLLPKARLANTAIQRVQHWVKTFGSIKHNDVIGADVTNVSAPTPIQRLLNIPLLVKGMLRLLPKHYLRPIGSGGDVDIGRWSAWAPSTDL